MLKLIVMVPERFNVFKGLYKCTMALRSCWRNVGGKLEAFGRNWVLLKGFDVRDTKFIPMILSSLTIFLPGAGATDY